MKMVDWPTAEAVQTVKTGRIPSIIAPLFWIGILFSSSKFYFWIFRDYENKRFVNWAELGPKKVFTYKESKFV